MAKIGRHGQVHRSVWTYVDPYGLFEWSEDWMENAWSMAKGASQAAKNAAVDAATEDGAVAVYDDLLGTVGSSLRFLCYL